MKKRIWIPTLAFIVLIGSVLINRFNPVLFDFNVIHNMYGLNVLYRDQTALPRIIGLIALAVTLVFGPVFCGYICPFGSLQKILQNVGMILGIQKKTPIKVHKYLSVIKYLVLIIFIFLLFSKQVMTYIEIDPYHAFIRLFFGGISLYGGLYLIAVIILSLFVERPFCNYLCPYGAGLNLISSQRILRIKRTDECIKCRKCDQHCPVQINVSTINEVKNINCLSCDKCIHVCPKAGALEKKVNVKGIIFSIIVISIAFYYTMPKEKPVIDIEEEPIIEVPIVEEIEVEPIKTKPVLKASSTEEAFFDNPVDFIPMENIAEKNLEAIVRHQEYLAQQEAERKAKEEAERIAKEKEEAKRKAEEEAKKKAEEEAKKKAEEEANQELGQGEYYYDGTYKATVNAFAPDMTVQVTIKNDKITAIEILDHNESRSYYNYAAPKMFKKILEANTPEVSIVAGCTYTSLGIKNGVRNCLLQAKK